MKLVYKHTLHQERPTSKLYALWSRKKRENPHIIFPISSVEKFRLSHEAVVTAAIRVRFECDSTAIRVSIGCSSIALRPFDDLRYVVVGWCTAAETNK